MKVVFLNSFKKDLKKVKNKALKLKIKTCIISLENEKNLRNIKSCKKLSGSYNVYRIRIGDYRLGFYLDDKTIFIVRFLKRSEIYRVFP